MWEQIRDNQTKSFILVAAMAILFLAFGFFIGIAFFGSAIAGLIMSLVIWAIMTAVAYFQGDNIFLSISKAKKIERDDHPRLYNIVEEMKIASGLPYMPSIYIIDDPALNAFATGRDPSKASVAVTSGLLQKLNRDELQGVIGHEMAHIKNRDVLLMSMCGVLLGAMVMISWYMTRMLFWGSMTGGRRNSGGGGGGQIILVLIGVLLMILAPIFARLIYFAISRKREYLADASSAQYTRYPEGLASALEKLSDSTAQLQTANQAMAPMYISNPFRNKGQKAADLSSTHPPISERIRVLRAMGGGASLSDYEKAYEQVHSGGGRIMKPATAATAGAMGIRPASPESTIKEADPDKVERTREVNDLMWKQNNYKIINCDCGTKLKIPPKFNRPQIKCPHCGRVHQV